MFFILYLLGQKFVNRYQSVILYNFAFIFCIFRTIFVFINNIYKKSACQSVTIDDWQTLLVRPIQFYDNSNFPVYS